MMMRTKYPIIFFIILLYTICYGSIDDLAFDDVREKFKSFQYEEVIRLSKALLDDSGELSREEQIELYEMRAISFYSIDDLTAAINAYANILAIDPAFVFDPVKTSPKIIAFFDDIRPNLATDQNNAPAAFDSGQRDSLDYYVKESQLNKNLRGAMPRSIVLPGWGHLHRDMQLKGWTLLSLSAVTLGGGIYFAGEARSKEEAYLNETDPDLIDSRYDDFNTAYKRRNLFLAAYGLVWLFAQADLLFFSRQSPEPPTVVHQKVRIWLDVPSAKEFQIGLQIPVRW